MTNPAGAMPFASLRGIEISEASVEGVVGTLTIRPEICTVGDSVHGGTLMAFADTLGALGAFLALPDGSAGTTTIESKTNFTGPAAAGTKLTGVATPVSVGRRVSLGQTRITDPDEWLAALITQTQLVH